MKKIIRLTESDLTRIVKRIIEEENNSKTNKYGFVKVNYPNPSLISKMESDKRLRGKNFNPEVKIDIRNINKNMSKAYYKKWMDSKDYTERGFNKYAPDDFKFDGFWRKPNEIGEHIAYVDMYGHRYHFFPDGKLFIEGIGGYSGWKFKEFEGEVYFYFY